MDINATFVSGVQTNLLKRRTTTGVGLVRAGCDRVRKPKGEGGSSHHED